MANYSTLEHSKTLGKTQIRNFSTLATFQVPAILLPTASVPAYRAYLGIQQQSAPLATRLSVAETFYWASSTERA